MEGLINVVDQV